VARWTWLALLVALVGIAVLLAWMDATVLRPLFPVPFEPPRRPVFRPAPAPLPLPVGRREETMFKGLGPVGGLYTFWWFLSVAAGLVLVILAVLVAVPGRSRRAAERVSRGSLPLMLVAGVATMLLGLALTVLLRTGFVLLSIVPLVWGGAVLGAVFGLAALALAWGRWLRARLGPAPPLLAALTVLLVLVDVGLVPLAGWVVVAVTAIAALGLSVLTRVGSPTGWSLDELNW
jgi:hypothetical protein